MPSETTSISGPVSVVSDAKQRVAFDLMKHIGYECNSADQELQRTKDYWLRLYRQCYKATSGMYIETVLKDKE